MGGGASIDESLMKETLIESSSETPETPMTAQNKETVGMIVRMSSARLTKEGSNLGPLPSMLTKAQSMKFSIENSSENDEVLFYAKDLFYEVAGDADEVEMAVFQMLFDEILFHITLKEKRLKLSSRRELSDSLLERLTNELGMKSIRWNDVEALFGSICESVVRYTQLFNE